MGTNLHDIWVQFPDARYTAVLLYLGEAAFECLELVVDGKKSFRDGFGRDHKMVDVAIATADEVKKCLYRH